MFFDTPRRRSATVTAHVHIAPQGAVAVPPNGDWALLDTSDKPSWLSGPLTVPSITLESDPTEALQAATKQYIDNALAPVVAGGGRLIARETTKVRVTGTASINDVIDAFVFTLPGDMMGLTGRLEVEVAVSNTESVNTKRVRFMFGGVIAGSYQWTTSTTGGGVLRFVIENIGAANTQFIAGTQSFGWGETPNDPGFPTIDTTQDVECKITGALGLGSEFLDFHTLFARVFPGV